jgi:ATP-dependent DNA helicase RecG
MAIEQNSLSLRQMTPVQDRERVFGSSEERSEKIFAMFCSEARLSARVLAEHFGLSPKVMEKQIAKLREQGHLRRIGQAKGGHWEVMQ